MQPEKIGMGQRLAYSQTPRERHRSLWPFAARETAQRSHALPGTPGRVIIVNGHPDPRAERFCASLCHNYAAGVEAAGGEAHTISLGLFPSLFESDGCVTNDPALATARNLVSGPNQNVVVVFPLWLDAPPAIVTRFFSDNAASRLCIARVVITMGLPALMYRSRFQKRDGQGQFRLPGCGVIAAKSVDLVGSIDALGEAERTEWLQKAHGWGQQPLRETHSYGAKTKILGPQ
ncbi:MAG: hypothetical protein GC166_07495 [Alphaproteobacteria bacterium]|nr:hypothetical protein [Alphaproteobacteria bacterium]